MKYLPLIWAGVWRRPGRATLTLLSIVNAFLLFGLLHGFVSGLAGAKAEAFADVLLTSSRVSAAELLPTSLVGRFRNVPGVIAVSPVSVLFGYYQKPDQYVRAYGFHTTEVPKTTPGIEIAPATIVALRGSRTAMIVSEELMKKFGWKIGDRVPLTSSFWVKQDGGRTWDFDIVGTYSAPSDVLLRNALIFDYDYLDQSLAKDHGMTNVLIERVANSTRAGEIAASFDQLTRNSPYETKTKSESQYARDLVESIGDVGLLVNSIVGAVFFTLIISVGGVMAESTRERTREIGVLKAIGFSDWGALALVAAEAILVCGCAALAGLSIAGALFPLATRLIGFTAIQQGPVLFEGLALATALALASGLPPALRALRLPIIVALGDR